MFKNLLEVLWTDLPRDKYGIGGQVDAATYCMPTSIRVEGVGDLALPLSCGDFLRLKAVSAPYGEQTDVWQVEGSKVSCPQEPDFFSKVVHDLAVPALSELGVDANALGLEVRLYKLLSYEQGSHLRVRDTEREAGKFGTMILQLPTRTGYEGGQLEICHRGKTSTFDFSGPNSATGYFNTVFFCDCEHKLLDVTGGSSLCLVFSLVMKNMKFIDMEARNLPNYISALKRLQSLLRKQQDVLAIPLGRKYSKNNLSFAGLKGYDRVVAALVLSCFNFLDIHLCMLKKVTFHNEGLGINEDTYIIGNWTTVEDSKSQHLGDCLLDIECIAHHKIDPFDGEEPDKQSAAIGLRGLHEDAVNSFSKYYGAALVVWPKDTRVTALRSLNRTSAEPMLELLEQQHVSHPERTSNDFHRYLETVMIKPTDPTGLANISRFCIKHDFRKAVFTMMEKWSMVLITNKPEAVVSVIQKYGWDAYDIKKVIGSVLKRDNLITFSKVAEFPKYLGSAGLESAAFYFAKKLISREDISNDDLSMQYVNSLLTFFLDQSLEEEAWCLLGRLSFFRGDFFARVVLKWGQRSCPRIEERMKEEEKCLPRDDGERRMSFLREVVQFAVAIECRGYYGAASAFVAKFVKDADETLWAGERPIQAVDAFVLLLCHEERMYEILRRVEDCENFLCNIRKNARLIGLKSDDKVTQLFAELLSAEIRARPSVKLLDNVFWLGDAGVISTVLELAADSSHPELARVLDRNDFNRTRDACRFFLEESWKDWDEVGKRGFRELLKARMRFFSVVCGEEREPKRQKFVTTKLERIKHDERVENAIAEVERLQKLLDSIA